MVSEKKQIGNISDGTAGREAEINEGEHINVLNNNGGKFQNWQSSHLQNTISAVSVILLNTHIPVLCPTYWFLVVDKEEIDVFLI